MFQVIKIDIVTVILFNMLQVLKFNKVIIKTLPFEILKHLANTYNYFPLTQQYYFFLYCFEVKTFHDNLLNNFIIYSSL